MLTTFFLTATAAITGNHLLDAGVSPVETLTAIGIDVCVFVVVSVATVDSVALIDVNLSWSPEASSFVSSFFSVEVNWAKWNGTGPFSQGKMAHQLNLILMRLSDSLSRCVDSLCHSL